MSTELEVRTALGIIDLQSGVFTERQLLRAYRRQALANHPDLGGSRNDFNRLDEAYKLLKDHAIPNVVKDDEPDTEGPLKTVQGQLLSELGRGLPIIVSAKDCGECEGKGYKVIFNYSEWGLCLSCGGTGASRVECDRCAGTGKYKHPHSGEVIGPCYKCNGRGIFYISFKQRLSRFNFGLKRRWVEVVIDNGRKFRAEPCSKCDGKGDMLVEDQTKPAYLKCGGCKGTGEIKLWNPVIPRGFLAAK